MPHLTLQAEVASERVLIRQFFYCFSKSIASVLVRPAQHPNDVLRYVVLEREPVILLVICRYVACETL